VFATTGSDLEGLAVYDTNHDGQLSSADADFANFQVWQDANSNGTVEAGEMHSLTALGIASISLSSDGIGYSAAGGDVQVVGTGSYARTDGSTGVLADAVFTTGAAAASQEEQSKASVSANTAVLAAAVAAAGLAASAPAAAAPHGESQASPHSVDAPLSGGFELSPVAASAVAKLQVAEQLAISSDHKGATVSDSYHPAADAPALQTHLDTMMPHMAPADLLHGSETPMHNAVVGATPFAAPSVAMPSAAQLGALAAQTDTGTQHHQVVAQVLADALHAGGSDQIDHLLGSIASHGGPPQLGLAALGQGDVMAMNVFHDAALLHLDVPLGVMHADAPPPPA
jgi:hypothetical protein